MVVRKALWRNPVLFVPVLAWSFVQVPELLVREVDPALAGALAPGRTALFVFVTPFFHAGILGMADEALDEYTSLDAFVRAAKANYASMLGAYLLVLAMSSVLGVVALLGACSADCSSCPVASRRSP